MKKKKRLSNFWIFIVLLLVSLLIWGIIGGIQAQEIGVTCDMGIGDNLCWKWHKNIVGQTQEFLNEVLK